MKRRVSCDRGGSGGTAGARAPLLLGLPWLYPGGLARACPPARPPALLAQAPRVSLQSKNAPHSQGEYDVYSTFQSHEPEFDYLKSLEIEEKINKIKWLPQQNAAHSLLSTNGEARCLRVCLGVCVPEHMCARVCAHVCPSVHVCRHECMCRCRCVYVPKCCMQV